MVYCLLCQELLADMYKNASDEDRAGLRDAMCQPKLVVPQSCLGQALKSGAFVPACWHGEGGFLLQIEGV